MNDKAEEHHRTDLAAASRDVGVLRGREGGQLQRAAGAGRRRGAGLAALSLGAVHAAVGLGFYTRLSRRPLLVGGALRNALNQFCRSIAERATRS